MGCCTESYSNVLGVKEKSVIKEALDVLGKKNFALIIHNGSFPSAAGENTGFGSSYTKGGRELIEYLSGIFNSIQLGPAGKTKSCDASPYAATIFSNNPLFLDLKELTTPLWHKILSVKTYDSIVEGNPNKTTTRTAYGWVYRKYQDAMLEAFENFQKINDEKFKREYDIYIRENSDWLDKDALYEALTIEHQNDYWPMWKSELDKNLFNPQSNEEKIHNAKRIDELEKKYEKEIGVYKFTQFVLSRQLASTRDFAKKNGIKMIADRQVAFSDRDTWAYQSLFLKGYSLGCPPDYFSKDGQSWGFPVIDPEKIFRSDGSLDDGGILLKSVFDKMFKENPGGVRIDHLVGLIDPWVYKTNKTPKVEDGAGRLYSSPEHKELKRYAIARIEDLNNDVSADNELRVKNLTDNQVKRYAEIIDKIVIQSAKEAGLDTTSIVCEDLGTLTNPVAEVMKKYNLFGMKLTQFTNPENENDPYRCKNIKENCWAMVGTHDNQPIKMWANSMIYTHIGYLHARNLVEDLYKDFDNKDDIIVRLTNDSEFLRDTKLTELFASKAENIQIFFTDYFNIYETYNIPGTSGDKNWSLRLPDNYKELHTINLAQILKSAIIARGKDFALKNQKLIDKLDEIK